MRSFINKVNVKITSAVFAAGTRVRDILKTESGEGFVDTSIKILIAVVIGALVLSGLYLLFKNTVLPTITTKITDMFNFKG